MDENKHRQRWLTFGIRDWLWAMVVVGLILGWWVERQQHHATERQMGFLRDAISNSGYRASGTPIRPWLLRNSE